MNTHTATLIRGETYFLGTKRFDRGTPVPVTDAEKRTLEEDPAFRKVQHEGGPDGDSRLVKEPVSRFEFKSLKTESPAAALAPNRTRSRPAAPAPVPAPAEAVDELPETDSAEE